MDESRWFLTLVWKLPSAYPTLCYKEIWVSPKIGYLPLGFYSGVRKFRLHGKSKALSTELLVVESIVEFVDDTYMTIDKSWLFSTSRSAVTL